MVVDGGSQAGKGPQRTAPATKFTLQGPQSTATSTKLALQDPQSAAPPTKSALQGPQSTAPATISDIEPHVQKSQFTAPATKTDHAKDHHRLQSTAPATNSRGFPFACHENWSPSLKMRTARAHLRQSTLPQPAFRATLHREIAFGDFSTELLCEPAQPKQGRSESTLIEPGLLNLP